VEKGIECPKCKKNGGIICRKDAFAIFKIEKTGGVLIDTEVFDEVDGYHCIRCDSEVEYNDISDQTNW
jgi:DNA-directed RNA polymerase subunit RPC12/RpoP